MWQHTLAARAVLAAAARLASQLGARGYGGAPGRDQQHLVQLP